MNYFEKLQLWTDSDGLIGNCPNPVRQSTGNPILDTAFVIRNLVESNDPLADQFIDNYIQAISNLRASNGLFNKKADSNDEVTFDDLIGVASSSPTLAEDICEFGIRNNWILSNTGKFYWTAVSRPQYIAFYKWSSCIFTPNLFQRLLFYISNVFISKTLSGLRLQYLVLETCKYRNKITKFLAKRFSDYLKRKYGSIQEVNMLYYDSVDHPVVNL